MAACLRKCILLYITTAATTTKIPHYVTNLHDFCSTRVWWLERTSFSLSSRKRVREIERDLLSTQGKEIEREIFNTCSKICVRSKYFLRNLIFLPLSTFFMYFIHSRKEYEKDDVTVKAFQSYWRCQLYVCKFHSSNNILVL